MYVTVIQFVLTTVEIRSDGFKKSLKIPKGNPETVNRRTDNTMAIRKRTKGQTMIYKRLHKKLNIELHEPQ